MSSERVEGEGSYALRGKHVLVTGASAGIGAALARGFAGRGAVVGICARREDRLREVFAECRASSPSSRMWAVDLADLDGLAAWAKRADEELGGIDVLVHNAGMPKRRQVIDLDVRTVEQVMALNYFSPVRLTLALLPKLIERRGRIVHISSVAARLSPPGEAAYSASKAALSAWAESLAADLWHTGLRVHVVYPGVFDTELFHLPDNDPSLTPIEALPADSIVEPILKQIESGALELYVPDYFAALATQKAGNTGAFIEGSAAWMRERRAEQARKKSS